MKIGFLSLGCPKNLVDGEVMLGIARDAGHELTADAASADVLVVNTCAFIDSAKQESIDAILEMAQQKRDGRCRRLVVTGCLAERYREELKKEIPEIDALLGTGEVEGIVGAIEGGRDQGSGIGDPKRLGSGATQPVRLFRSRDLADPGSLIPDPGSSGLSSGATSPLPTYLYDSSTPRMLTTPRHYAYVKIAEGCDYTCAFCIIPTLRGA
jgi:ribosomal protein S12 methylthiotransferase